MPAPSAAKSKSSRRSRLRPVKQRVAEALSTLASEGARSTSRPTIARLSGLASVSRNTLYRYYPDVAETVRRLRRRRGTARQSAQENTLKTLRAEIVQLHEQAARLAALADHYCTAAEEQRALVVRRDRELAALRDRSRLTPTRIHG